MVASWGTSKPDLERIPNEEEEADEVIERDDEVQEEDEEEEAVGRDEERIVEEKDLKATGGSLILCRRTNIEPP